MFLDDAIECGDDLDSKDRYFHPALFSYVVKKLDGELEFSERQTNYGLSKERERFFYYVYEYIDNASLKPSYVPEVSYVLNNIRAIKEDGQPKWLAWVSTNNPLDLTKVAQENADLFAIVPSRTLGYFAPKEPHNVMQVLAKISEY